MNILESTSGILSASRLTKANSTKSIGRSNTFLGVLIRCKFGTKATVKKQSRYREKNVPHNVDTFISGGSSVQLGLSHQAWSCLSKRISAEAAAAEHDCFAFSDDISALMRRP